MRIDKSRSAQARAARYPDAPIVDALVTPWSRRTISAEPLTDAESVSPFEPARWKPSTFNSHVLRVVYAGRDALHSVKKAGLIALLASITHEHNGEPYRRFRMNDGANRKNLMIQGCTMGLVDHAIQGFDCNRAKATLGIPADQVVVAMIVAKRPGMTTDLSEGLQPSELPPRRRPVDNFTFERSLRPARARSRTSHLPAKQKFQYGQSTGQRYSPVSATPCGYLPANFTSNFSLATKGRLLALIRCCRQHDITMRHRLRRQRVAELSFADAGSNP